jgi:hypothetical protein
MSGSLSSVNISLKILEIFPPFTEINLCIFHHSMPVSGLNAPTLGRRRLVDSGAGEDHGRLGRRAASRARRTRAIGQVPPDGARGVFQRGGKFNRAPAEAAIFLDEDSGDGLEPSSTKRVILAARGKLGLGNKKIIYEELQSLQSFFSSSGSFSLVGKIPPEYTPEYTPALISGSYPMTRQTRLFRDAVCFRRKDSDAMRTHEIKDDSNDAAGCFFVGKPRGEARFRAPNGRRLAERAWRIKKCNTFHCKETK